ncbi:MAG: IPT/TIG domain-containing protein [Prolixibacteraceae bacterium]|nr:IPT/TIG domain-containing protein [Prolixibacteraceae bacterium]
MINIFTDLSRFLLFFMLVSCGEKELGNPIINGPVINSFSPKSGSEGTPVTLDGGNFSTIVNQNIVTISGKNVEVKTATTTRLTFELPSGITPGSYAINVKVGNLVSDSKEHFVVTGKNTGNFVSKDIVPVTAEVVNTCFFGFGKKDIHPRLIFTATDIVNLKSLINSDAMMREYQNDIIAQANNILSKPLLTYGLDGANLRIPNIHTFGNDHVPYLVIAYQLTKDARYAQRCWQQIDEMSRWPDWGAARHFLDTGIGAKGVALAYDGCYDAFTAEQRTKIAEALRKYALEPGKTQIETGTGAWKWYLSDNNWNGICHGGLMMAALAIYETDPVFMSKIVQLCANGIVPYMNSLDPDGASEEGMMYWSYGLSNTFLAFESMKNVLSTTYGLTEFSGFKKTPAFPYKVSGPAGTATLGDDYLYYGSANRFMSYFWYGYHFNDANFCKTHYDLCLSRNAGKTLKFNGWIDFLYYRPELVTAGSATAAPLNGYIKGVEYMYVSESNTDPNSLYIGMHGGDNNANHGHLDAGTFFVQALGENFAIGNLGKEDPYPADFFTYTSPKYTDSPVNTASSPGRFYYYRVRTEGKSCLVFNPDARPEQDPVGVATVTKEGGDNIGGFYILNLKDCYKRDVDNYARGIKLNRNSGVVSIQDEFKPLKNSTVYWLMHSPSTDNAVISSDGKTVTMTKNGKVLYAIIKSPEDARFEIINRSENSINYLNETAQIFNTVMNGKNGFNKWYGKLQIKLTDVKPDVQTTIRVDFVKNTNVSTPAISKLADWTTTN